MSSSPRAANWAPFLSPSRGLCLPHTTSWVRRQRPGAEEVPGGWRGRQHLGLVAKEGWGGGCQTEGEGVFEMQAELDGAAEHPMSVETSGPSQGEGPEACPSLHGTWIHTFSSVFQWPLPGVQGKLSKWGDRPMYLFPGTTSVEEWKNCVQESPAPWGELATDNIILTVPTADLRTLENPEPALRLWDEMMRAIAQLAAKPFPLCRPERIVADVQISAGGCSGAGLLLLSAHRLFSILPFLTCGMCKA